MQCVEQGPQQQLLICTANRLVLYDPTRQQQQIFDRQQGLTGDNIVGAYTDQQQNIWLLSAKGLTLKPAGEQRFINFTKLDGLVATELVLNLLLMIETASVVVGTINGLTIVKPILFGSMI